MTLQSAPVMCDEGSQKEPPQKKQKEESSGNDDMGEDTHDDFDRDVIVREN